MSVVTGLALTMILSLILVAFTVYQIGKIVHGRVQELDQVIKVLKRENRLEEDLTVIKSYIITSENIMSKIEKVVTEADDNDNDLLAIHSRKKNK